MSKQRSRDETPPPIAPWCACILAGEDVPSSTPFPLAFAVYGLDRVLVTHRASTMEVQGQRKSLLAWLREPGRVSKKKSRLR